MDTAFIWLIAIPLAASPVIYLAGRLGSAGRAERAASPARWAALLALLAAWIPFVLAVQYLAAHGPAVYKSARSTSRLDGFSLSCWRRRLSLGTLVMLFSGQYMAGEDGEEKYYALLIAMVGAMIGLGCANDLFNLWVWFEAMAISSYMLVAFYRDSRRPGSRDEVPGAELERVGAGAVGYRTGLGDERHARSDSQLQKAAQSTPVLLAAGALFVIGFGVKTALVPMHTWLPRRPLPGAQRDQRHAVRRGDRSRPGRHAARPGSAGRPYSARGGPCCWVSAR